MRLRAPAIVAIAACIALAAGACATGPASTPKPTTSKNTTATDTLSGSITVFGAASLTGTFTELAEKFMAEHNGVTVATSFAGSSDLVTQITAGAPADVFASADTKNMDKVTDLVNAPVNFASNVLEIAVPPGNPASITSFADLAKPGVKTVVCAPQVPCGTATVAVEKASGVTLAPVSEENSVTDVLGKVSSGEADAGLVYVTDIKGAGSSVKGISFAESSQAVNTYPIAVIKASSNAKVASAFVDFVTGEAGRAVLKAAGFGAPTRAG